MKKTLLFLTILSVFASSLQAQQQWMNPYSGGRFNNPISSYLDTAIMTSIQKKMLEGSIQGSSFSQPELANYAATAFEPQQKMLIWSGINLDGLSTEQISQLEELYGNLLKTFDDALVAEGDEARRNNVATAFLYLVFSSHYVRTRQELTDSQQTALFDAFYSTLSTDPAFLAADNDRKQMMYEALVTTAGLMLALDQQGRQGNDPDAVLNAKNLADESWRTVFGEAGNQYTIGPDGAIVNAVNLR